MRERGCQMRHFRAIAQDLAALDFCFLLFDDRNKDKKNGGKYKSVHI